MRAYPHPPVSALPLAARGCRRPQHLLKSVPVAEDSLAHALKYGLERRRTQCIEAMRADLPRYVGPLGALARPESRALLEALWPELCAAASVPEYAMPDVETVRAMWPFVTASIASGSPLTKLQAEFTIKSDKLQAEVCAAVVGHGIDGREGARAGEAGWGASGWEPYGRVTVAAHVGGCARGWLRAWLYSSDLCRFGAAAPRS